MRKTPQSPLKLHHLAQDRSNIEIDERPTNIVIVDPGANQSLVSLLYQLAWESINRSIGFIVNDVLMIRKMGSITSIFVATKARYMTTTIRTANEMADIAEKMFVDSLTDYFQSGSDYSRIQAAAYERLLLSFGWSEKDMNEVIDDLRSKTKKK